MVKNNKHMGNQLKELKQELNCTIDEFSKILGISPNTFRKCESGERPIHMDEFLNLCNYLKKNTKINVKSFIEKFFS